MLAEKFPQHCVQHTFTPSATWSAQQTLLTQALRITATPTAPGGDKISEGHAASLRVGALAGSR